MKTPSLHLQLQYQFQVHATHSSNARKHTLYPQKPSWPTLHLKNLTTSHQVKSHPLSKNINLKHKTTSKLKPTKHHNAQITIKLHKKKKKKHQIHSKKRKK